MVHHHVAAFRRSVNHLGLPWPKRWRANFCDLGAALCVQRTLVVRGLARTLTGPQRAMRYADKRLRRFLGNERFNEKAMDAAGALWAAPATCAFCFLACRALLKSR